MATYKESTYPIQTPVIQIETPLFHYKLLSGFSFNSFENIDVPNLKFK